ncbi:MAG: hypothetical protein IIY06_03910 [Proteobacteria bacterium]|nr:hypothetical protein [Pseudomonadota bacterium]
MIEGSVYDRLDHIEKALHVVRCDTINVKLELEDLTSEIDRSVRPKTDFLMNKIEGMLEMYEMFQSAFERYREELKSIMDISNMPYNEPSFEDFFVYYDERSDEF